jgi:hypothetical protein
MPRITISYRRDDSGVITGRIFDRLAAHYGRDAVFRDIDSIPPGADFRQHINQVIENSNILLAIVGPRWLGTRSGLSRLDDEADPVRIEIEASFRNKLPVIPVLVLRATMPRAGQLPETIRDLAYRHAVQIDAGQDFDVHAARLIRAVDLILKQGLSGAPVLEYEAAGETIPSAPLDSEALDHAGSIADDATGSEPALPLPVDVTRVAQRERRRGSNLVAGLVIGAIFGAVTAAAVVGRVMLTPAQPPDISALATAKLAAETRTLTLQASLSDSETKRATLQNALDAAQKQTSDQQKQLSDLHARADQAAKDLAAQTNAAAEARARADSLQAELKNLADRLTTEKKAHQNALDLVAQLEAKIKAPPPKPIASAAAVVAPVPPGAVLVKSGVDTRVGSEVRWNRVNCTAMNTAPINIKEAPKHGTVTTHDGIVPIPKVAVVGISGACAGKLALGANINYQSEQGFQGADRIVYDTLRSDGVWHQVIIDIAVR